jgi:phage gpG-like protein
MALAADHLVRVVKKKLSGEVLKVRSNRLRGSIARGPVQGDGKVLQVVVGTNVVYARIHEFGGVIVPKRKKYLRFVVDGKTVFAKRVVIPKRPYIAPSIAEGAKAMVTIIGREIEKGLA